MKNGSKVDDIYIKTEEKKEKTEVEKKLCWGRQEGKISWNQKIWDTEINLVDPNLIELNLEINEDWRGWIRRLQWYYLHMISYFE